MRFIVDHHLTRSAPFLVRSVAPSPETKGTTLVGEDPVFHPTPTLKCLALLPTVQLAYRAKNFSQYTIYISPAFTVLREAISKS